MLLFVICIIGLGLLIRHHYMDYDVAAILRNAKLPIIPQKTKTVSSLSQIHHVFVIVEENHDWSTIYKNSEAPFINNTLLTNGAFANDYHNVDKDFSELHPSEPNYILLEAGMIAFPDHVFTTDNAPSDKNSTDSDNHLSFILADNGYSWKSYQEDISGTDCPINAVNNYAPKHNPFIYFQDVVGNPPNSANKYCQKHVRPLSELQNDLQTGHVSNYNFITPNLQNDMHDGSVAQADTWLSQIVPMITNSPMFKKDGVLFITWDEGNEDNDKNNSIGMIIESPFVKKGYSNSISYSHASLVKTIEEIFHLSPMLGFASHPTTNDLTDFFIKSK